MKRDISLCVVNAVAFHERFSWQDSFLYNAFVWTVHHSSDHRAWSIPFYSYKNNKLKWALPVDRQHFLQTSKVLSGFSTGVSCQKHSEHFADVMRIRATLVVASDWSRLNRRLPRARFRVGLPTVERFVVYTQLFQVTTKRLRYGILKEIDIGSTNRRHVPSHGGGRLSCNQK